MNNKNNRYKYCAFIFHRSILKINIAKMCMKSFVFRLSSTIHFSMWVHFHLDLSFVFSFIRFCSSCIDLMIHKFSKVIDFHLCIKFAQILKVVHWEIKFQDLPKLQFLELYWIFSTLRYIDSNFFMLCNLSSIVSYHLGINFNWATNSLTLSWITKISLTRNFHSKF